MLSQYKLKDYNFRLLLMVVVLSIIGILLVGSADASLQSRQMFGVIAGIGIIIVFSLIDYSWILNLQWIIYGVNIVLLVWVLVMGATRKGASRWIEINGFQFQPTEVSKILMILFFALYLMQNEDSLNEWRTILKGILFALPPLILILRQPDLKNTITMLLIIFLMFFVAGMSYKKIGTILLVIVGGFVLVMLLITQTNLPILRDYQRNRILTFWETSVDGSTDDQYSESAIQQQNSITAIGSGQITGKGLNNTNVSSSNRGNFVAERQNDFIFAVAGEELGFVGCVVIILLLLGIVFECVRTGRRAKDLSGTLICCGVASLIAIQSFINIAVATGLFPNTGTPLPFVSYGLTSLFCMCIGVGLVMNVGLQNRNYFES